MRGNGHDNYATTKCMLGVATGGLVTGLLLARQPLPETLLGLWVFGSAFAAWVYLSTSTQARKNAPFVVGVLLGEVGAGCFWGCLRSMFNSLTFGPVAG